MEIFIVFCLIAICIIIGSFAAMLENDIFDPAFNLSKRREEKEKAKREAKEKQWLFEAEVESGI